MGFSCFFFFFNIFLKDNMVMGKRIEANGYRVGVLIKTMGNWNITEHVMRFIELG